MWKEKLLTLLSSLNRRQLAALALFLIGFVLLSSGLIYSLSTSGNKNDITFESGSTSSSTGVQAGEQKITVDVEGAVITPGVYSLSSNSRTKDALIAAGGLVSNADRGWIAKNLNLALKLSDAMKIYIPFQGETHSASSGQGSLGVVQSSQLVNINSASLSDLDTLPGIGPVTAQKIIDGRPYSSVDDLLTKKIVKSSVFTRIKDKLTY